MDGLDLVDDRKSYQEAVRRLTAENRELKAALAEEGQLRRDEVRVLRAQLNEGISPELVTLRRELSRWRTRANAAESRLKAGAR